MRLFGQSRKGYSPKLGFRFTAFSKVRRSPAPRLPSARPILLATPATSVPSPPAQLRSVPTNQHRA
jgi:hypothetical protein